MEVLAIRIEDTTCNYRCQVKLPTRNNCCQKGLSKLSTRGLKRVQLPSLKIMQLPFCERATNGSLSTTIAVKTNTQAIPPAK